MLKNTLMDIFMSVNNQICVTKQIYLEHRQNHGKLQYSYFKSIISQKMYNWIQSFNIPNNIDSIGHILYIKYLNKTFIKQHYDLYEFRASDTISNDAKLDTNVYRTVTTIGYCDDEDNIITKESKYGNLMAVDYGSIDVWKEQTTEISTDQLNRGSNMVKLQKAMNTRNYDRNNEGYASTPARSSLNNIVSGYGSNMDLISSMKEKLYQKNNSF